MGSYWFEGEPSSDLNCAFRAMVDLATENVSAQECVAIFGDLGTTAASAGPPLLELRIEDVVNSLWRAPYNAMVVSLAPEQFVADSASDSDHKIRKLVSDGRRFTVLLGCSPEVPARGVGDAIARWRRLGCEVGLDNFGYAQVPALWPLVHAVDMVRIDARLLVMHRAGAIDAAPICRLLEFLKGLGIPQIVVDGCAEAWEAKLLLAHGATLGQGPHFGNVRRSLPVPVYGKRS